MTERVTVEQNGERFTLDVPDGTSDEQIQQFLTTQSQAQPQAPVAPYNSNDMAVSYTHLTLPTILRV